MKFKDFDLHKVIFGDSKDKKSAENLYIIRKIILLKKQECVKSLVKVHVDNF